MTKNVRVLAVEVDGEYFSHWPYGTPHEDIYSVCRWGNVPVDIYDGTMVYTAGGRKVVYNAGGNLTKIV